MSDLLPFDSINRINFVRKATNIPIDIRVSYKVIQLLLIIKYCGWGKKTDLQKIHLVNWFLNDNDAKNLYESMEIRTLINFIQIDPIVNFAVDYAIGYGFVKITRTGKLLITKNAELVIAEIESNHLMQDEIANIQKVNSIINQRGKK
jgi:GTP-dependent phosphoenolpyruvate carboxykinase